MGLKYSLNDQESEIILFNILQKVSNNNDEKIKYEHVNSIQLNYDLKNLQMEHKVSVHIKNTYDKIKCENIASNNSKEALKNNEKRALNRLNNYFKCNQNKNSISNDKNNKNDREQKNENLPIIKSINYLGNIKSNFILKKIINNIQRNKILGFFKYNKKFQEKLNININDYKDYCQIEIEIKPSLDKFGKFINILNKKDRKYFHIYFTDNEEIERIYLIKNEKINKITIKIDTQIQSFYKLFEDCKCIESVYFKKCNRNI